MDEDCLNWRDTDGIRNSKRDARLKLGREETFQRLLTSLILRAPYPRWNTRSYPSAQGVRFLRSLYELSFAADWPGDEFIFVDELESPARNDAEKGGAPDWAARSERTLLGRK